MIDIVQTNSRLKLFNISNEKDKVFGEIPTTYHKFVFCHSIVVPCVELSDDEILSLAERTGTFSFLNKPEEDIYTSEDGESIQ